MSLNKCHPSYASNDHCPWCGRCPTCGQYGQAPKIYPQPNTIPVTPNYPFKPYIRSTHAQEIVNQLGGTNA